MKINFRKIASALASTAMVGSTVALAAAANFPAPFVSNGAADVAIVYGASADLGSVTDISSALSAALSESSGGTPVSEEAYALFTGSTPVQLNNSINSVKTSITDTNLPSVLSETDFSGNVDAEVTFQLHPGSNPRVVFAKEPTSNDDPGVGVLLSTTSGNYFYNATATFSRAVQFNHTDSEGEELEMFGRTFTIASATDGDTLVLFQSAQTLSLSVGGSNPTPSSTVVVGDDTYTIELVAASDTSATVKVTDSSSETDTKEINEDASKKILGLEVAVTTADESTATNSLSAEIIVGANKLTFEDNTEVTVGSDNDPIDGTRVDFGNGVVMGVNLTTLTVQVFAPEGDEDFVQSGDSFVDPVFGGFRFALQGLSIEEDSTEDRETISVQNSGSDKISITATNWQDKELVNQVFINNESNSWGKAFLGDTNDWQIFVREYANINESAYAVVGNEDEGYLVRLKTLTNSSGSPIYTNDQVRFENVFDTAQTWEATITAEGTGSIDIGGKSYGVTYRDNGDDNVDGDQYVRLNYPDSSTTTEIVAFPTIETSKGAKLMFYAPQLINLTGATNDGTLSNLTSIRIPDGDGYSTITVAPDSKFYATNTNVTVTVGSGSATVLITNGSSSADGAIGDLTYNVTTGAQAIIESQGISGEFTGNGTYQIGLYLEDPAGVVIERPAVILLEEKDESNNYEAVIIQTGGAGSSTSGTGVTDVDFTWNLDQDFGASGGSAWGVSGFQLESDDDLYQMMDQFGTLVTTDQSDSDQYTATVSYPDEQVTALLYVDSLATSGGTTTLGDVKVMDDELATSGMQSKNLVVVGGSCVNSAASTLLSNAGCGTSWTTATGAASGEWIIQTFANPWATSKIATLVAGWEQGDTANAATYLTTQNPTTMSGSKIQGTTATTATVVTSGTA